MDEAEKKLSTESYKGVRDFYPEDMFIQNYIFDTAEGVVRSFGYQEYSASVLEPAELYEAKTGEEIVNEQTYTFEDRGGRKVTLRPEMTPTVARMIAAKKRELGLPLRWYSIPNLFRYERPQRGRLREHWQLNADLFGIPSTKADIEVILIAATIMRRFGAEDEQFEIRVNSREFMNRVFSHYNLSERETHALSKLIDRKHKMPGDAFKQELHEILKEKQDLHDILHRFIADNDFKALPDALRECDEKRALDDTLADLAKLDVENAVIDVSVMRGFDYYTGMVFEVFDTAPENNRSLFGGGRYDDLLRLFGTETLPAVGFGMGDVTMRDFLETHGLLPEYRSSATLYICLLEDHEGLFAQNLAKMLRENDIAVEIDLSERKIGDQIKTAHKHGVPWVVAIGKNEMDTGVFKLKNLGEGVETECRSADDIISLVGVKN